MRKALCLTVSMLVLASSLAQAATIQVNSLVANDFFDWAQLRVVDSTGAVVAVPSPVTVTSNLGRTAVLSDGVAFTGLIEGPDSDWTGNFLIGEHVLISADNPNLFPIDPVTGLPTLNPDAVAASFEVDLATAVAGLGLQITSNRFGDFVAGLEVYNSSNTLLGAFSVGGTLDGSEDGSAPFLGALSDSNEIARAVFTVVSVLENGDTAHPQGVGVNRLLTLDGNQTQAAPVPEPATIGLVALGAVGAMIRKRRADRQ
jgi:hypothetical protein